jgi:predicted membrane-bound mannosyltransferase
MTLDKVLYRNRVDITGGWRNVLMMHPLARLVFISLLAVQATPNTVWAQVKAVPPLSGVIGKVQSVADSSVDVQTSSGVVHIDITQPLTTYKQIPSDLNHVTSASYVGVASTEQADGKEVAKQIIIFPAELRGAAEGSVLTDPPGATTRSRMTNGSVARPATSHSRMTNGTVQQGIGTTLVVQYQDGSKTISVPANVPVVEVAPEKVTLAVGDTVYLTTDKLPNGTLTTKKILVIALAVSPNTRQ